MQVACTSTTKRVLASSCSSSVSPARAIWPACGQRGRDVPIQQPPVRLGISISVAQAYVFTLLVISGKVSIPTIRP
jgi:hypothetical protein